MALKKGNLLNVLMTQRIAIPVKNFITLMMEVEQTVFHPQNIALLDGSTMEKALNASLQLKNVLLVSMMELA